MEDFWGTIGIAHTVVALILALVGFSVYRAAVLSANRIRRMRGEAEEPVPTIEESLRDVLRELEAVRRGKPDQGRPAIEPMDRR